MPLAEVNGTIINYRFDGPDEGPVVMFSNSLAAALSMWDMQIPALVEAGYRVLRYDSRGHGQSSVSEGPYSIELLAEDAVGLMDAFGLEKVRFCGLSKGGMVGQMLATQYGDRLHSLVLSSTSAFMSPREIWDKRIETVQKDGMKAVVDATIDRWFTKAGQALLPLEVDRIRQLILNTPANGFCACCAAIRDMDQRDSIRAVSTKTLVVVGACDPSTPVSSAEFIHQQITPSELMVIAEAAHLVNVEKANVFNEVLLSFFE
ncbi:MAG: 3-oxoadipate enol-lactonase [Deltaproteobacteria bacterium]|nr:3-oxoadipate enol-lactonase [Candidatus Anaeroferrophillus wilburensis]MBN2889815.1 3-oxoadipate enol-lactonase [Deltaproteobacteria bacterium]